MRLALSSLLLLAATLAAAAPAPAPAPAAQQQAALHALQKRQDYCAGDASAATYCTELTFTDKTDAPSTSTSSDCQLTCRGILGDAGDWMVDFAGTPAGYVDGIYLGSCGIGIARLTDADAEGFGFYLTNQDLVALVGGSVGRFAGLHGGRVKAEGTMKCAEHVVRWFVG
ncbi:hypothetical protein GGR54DRAFT_623173 [Hypoxylon sp. NC1633]|nr:hypothetical protein GGR54DRAFT_623173 [Hypoxylon sp. NC1633]